MIVSFSLEKNFRTIDATVPAVDKLIFFVSAVAVEISSLPIKFYRIV